MKVNLLLFGRITEIVGYDHLQLQDVADTDSLSSLLVSEYPKLKQLNYKLAVNHVFIHHNTDLLDGMTVAVMPPFSGG